ncbi:hypothetical protein C7U57_24790 [Pseudomonas sp. R9.37]|nr:hypothetical protein C7U57_24790 [Pseudomonas sp. R9.37]
MLRPVFAQISQPPRHRPEGSKHKQSGFTVRAGLPAMQAPRSIRYTGLIPSQASQLPPLTEYKRAAPIYLMHCDPTVGAGLLAKAVVQSAHVSLTHRFASKPAPTS